MQDKLHILVVTLKQPLTQIPAAPANSRWGLPVSCFGHVERQKFCFVLPGTLSVFIKTNKYYRVPANICSV
jgi:hypothetical protein